MGSLRRAAALALASLLPAAYGCGGHGSAVPAVSRQSAGTTAALRIIIPKPGSASSSTRAPRYVSPATQSMSVLVTRHSDGTAVLNQTVGLTPTSAGCVSTLTTTICTLNLPLGPGTYDMTLATYDGYDAAHGTATGAKLSSGQSIGFTITAGQANTVSVTLSGIPASITVFSTAPAVRGSVAAGFKVYGYGYAFVPFTVAALDADGNYIVGPGSPTFSISSGSAFSVHQPTSANPNTFSLEAIGGVPATAKITATAAYPDSTCSTSGAVCSASFLATSAIQTLITADGYNEYINVFSYPYARNGQNQIQPSVSFSELVPNAVTTDGAGNIFVAGGSGKVTIFKPPFNNQSGSYATATTPDSSVNAVLVGADGTLYAGGTQAGYVFAPPYTGTPITLPSSGGNVAGLAVDASRDVFLAEHDVNRVTIYAPPYTGSPTVVTSGISAPAAVLVDPSGNLFVANSGSGVVTEYRPPYTGGPIQVGDSQLESYGPYVPLGLAMDGMQRLIVAGGSGVAVYVKPYTGTAYDNWPTGNGVQACAVAVDVEGSIWVAFSDSEGAEERNLDLGLIPASFGSGWNDCSLALDPH